MKILRLTIILLLSLVMQGCPPHSYGIYRYHEVQKNKIPVACIKSAIKSVHGVKYLDHKVTDGSQTFTLSGLLAPDQINKFIYSYEKQENRVTIINKTNNGLEYHHAANSYNRTEANLLVTKLIIPISEIDKAIEKQCSFTDLLNESSFKCDVEACKNSI